MLALNELKSILKSSGENYKECFGYSEGYWDSHAHEGGIEEKHD